MKRMYRGFEVWAHTGSYVAWRGDKRIGSRMSRDGIERLIDRILKREARADVDRDVDKYVQHN